MDSTAYRYRPAVEDLRRGRTSLRPAWENRDRVDSRAASRWRGAVRDWFREPGGAIDRASRPVRWGDFASGGAAAALGSAVPIYMGVKAISRKRSRSDPGSYAPGFDASASYGTYSDVAWRPGGAARWDRGPKRWDAPDQPWPTAASGGGGGSGGVSGGSRSHFNAKVRYERY